ncbi:MAG: cation diffusion facilitator family transporter [Leptolyngbya sp. SIO4C1]|nr:cation diffusion facilitator family transporter [Leptolyngbya sp. SIO4C1]
MNEEGRQRQVSYRLLLITLWATLLVLAIEVTAGWVSQSLCLLAEALHTLNDVFSTLLSLVAVASPRRSFGREIWGYGRGEAVGTLLLSATLGFAGTSLLILALRQFEASWQGAALPFPVDIMLPLVQLMSALVAILLTLSLVAAYQGRYLNSPALQLTTRHILRDVWLSILLLVALVAIWQGHRWVDPLFAIALVIMSVHSFWRVVNTQLPLLLQPTAIAPEAIAQIAGQVEGVTRCTRILSRGMVGRQVWIELHLALHPEFMSMARTIGERVENALRHQYGPVRTQIWVEQAQSAAYPNLPDAFDPPRGLWS